MATVRARSCPAKPSPIVCQSKIAKRPPPAAGEEDLLEVEVAVDQRLWAAGEAPRQEAVVRGDPVRYFTEGSGEGVRPGLPRGAQGRLEGAAQRGDGQGVLGRDQPAHPGELRVPPPACMEGRDRRADRLDLFESRREDISDRPAGHVLKQEQEATGGAIPFGEVAVRYGQARVGCEIPIETHLAAVDPGLGRHLLDGLVG